jgi:hypothetical protein
MQYTTLEKLMTGEEIVKYITAERIKWWGHLNKTEKTKTVRKSAEWNPIGVRSNGRPKNSWRDEVLNDLKKLKLKNWTHLVKDRKASYELEQKTKVHKGLRCQQKRKKDIRRTFK